MWPTKTKTTKYKELKTMSSDVGAVTVPDGFTDEYYKNFKNHLTQHFSNCSQNIDRKNIMRLIPQSQ